MKELVVVKGASLKFSDPTYQGNIQILPASVTTPRVRAEGSEIYSKIIFSISAFVGGSVPSEGIGGGAIIGSSGKARSGLLPFVKETDSVTVTVTGTGTPPPTQSVTIQIDNTGQNSVKVE